MADGSHPRRTQRAPLSCVTCYARKVKCNKEIPCHECTVRGLAAECRREKVSVRGRVYTAETPRRKTSYQSLVEENARLSALVASFTNNTHQPSSSPGRQHLVGGAVEQYEKRLLAAVAKSQQPRSVADHSQIAWPSKGTCDFLLDHAAMWTDWMHFAVPPYIRQEHELFWSSFTTNISVDSQDPLWLAVYFSILSCALLFVNETEFQNCTPSGYSHGALLRNWYDSALYFLDCADFLGRSDIAVIRATAILGIIAVNLGDSLRHEILWACAIRIGQQLNLGWDHLNEGETPIEQETRRRLWWQLVICEWLSTPLRFPCINEADFSCALPVDIDEQELFTCTDVAQRSGDQSPRPIQYHIAVAKISIVFNTLRSKLHSHQLSVSEITEVVIATDNELAAVIDDLPPHLQNDERKTHASMERDSRFPWIPWQRTDLTLILLYHRMCVNRVLQQYCKDDSVYYERARSICISSAIGIIRAAQEVPAHISRLRSWPPAMHVFTSVITLVLESNQQTKSSNVYSLDIQKGMEFLRLIEPDNVVAREALNILLEITGTQVP